MGISGLQADAAVEERYLTFLALKDSRDKLLRERNELRWKLVQSQRDKLDVEQDLARLKTEVRYLERQVIRLAEVEAKFILKKVNGGSAVPPEAGYPGSAAPPEPPESRFSSHKVATKLSPAALALMRKPPPDPYGYDSTIEDGDEEEHEHR